MRGLKSLEFIYLMACKQRFEMQASSNNLEPVTSSMQ